MKIFYKNWRNNRKICPLQKEERTKCLFVFKKLFFSPILLICGLYYKHVTIVIYDRNDSVQYHKTTITIVIDMTIVVVL